MMKNGYQLHEAVSKNFFEGSGISTRCIDVIVMAKYGETQLPSKLKKVRKQLTV